LSSDERKVPHRPNGDGQIKPSPKLAAGLAIEAGGKLGGRVTILKGKTTRHSIRSCGPFWLGDECVLLGVIPGERRWFVARNGVLFEYVGHGTRPHHPPIDPSGLEDGAVRLWADALAREFLDGLTGRATERTTEPMVARYHMLVRTLLRSTIVELARCGVEREAHHFAAAISRDWHEEEVLIGAPTIRHATYVTLALGLNEHDGPQLIEYAAFIELRLPIVQRETALQMYDQARMLLAILCPTWWTQGASTDWYQLGTSIEELFLKQHMRACTEARERDVPLDVLTGTRKALMQLGRSPLVSRYLDRNQVLQPPPELPTKGPDKPADGGDGNADG
jgi:hypothetical protein